VTKRDSEPSGKSVSQRWLVLFCTVGGTAVGAVSLVGTLVELSAYWAKGYTGMFGPVFSIGLSVVMSLVGGTACGVVAGLLASAGVSIARRVSTGWVAQAVGAAVGALTVVALTILRFNYATPLYLVVALSAAALGPFSYVALCSTSKRPKPEPLQT
jgi:hypothetical protein